MSLRRSPWLFGLVALVILGGGLWRLRFDADVLGLLPPGLPVVQGLKLQQAHFANAHELLLTVSSPDAETSASAAQALARGLEGDPALVRRAVWQPPWQEAPASVAEFLAWIWLQQPPAETSNMVARLQPEMMAGALRDAREQLAVSISPTDIARFSYDPLGLTAIPGSGGLADMDQTQRLFSSADGAFRLIFVEPASKLPNYKAEIAWLASVRGRVEKIRLEKGFPAGVRLDFTGGPVFAAEAAGGMEQDMSGSAPVTLVIIASLFWLAHRRLRPLLVIVVALVASVVGTLGLGGLLFGTLNVVSLGFAAILLGLVVDYGLMTYQKYVASPGESVAHLQREIGPGIFWSALTTAGAFLTLNLGGLPGLAQLGSLVALGVMLGMAIMLFGFLPLAVRKSGAGFQPAPSAPMEKPDPRLAVPAGLSPLLPFGWALTLMLLLACAGLAWRGLPRIDRSPEALRPRNSPAYAALDEMKTRLERTDEPLWLITSGRSEQEVSDRLQRIGTDLSALQTGGEVSSFTLASAWWPNPRVQPSNLAVLRSVVTNWPALRQAVLEAGFTTAALALDERIVAEWRIRLDRGAQDWPTGALGGWVFRQAAARSTNGFFAFGLIQPTTNSPTAAASQWSKQWEGSVVSGWMLLGESVLSDVRGRLAGVMTALVVVLLACFWGAFRRWQEMALSVLALVAGLLGLLGVMRLMGWSWNMLNLMALPLLLGSGAYYTIHVQLALRRNGDDLAAAWRTTGRALLLCAATTVTGFSSLAWAGNAGLASLGQICAAGIAMIFLVSMVALPAWWKLLVGRVDVRRADADSPPNKPSSFYSVTAWRAGLALARVLPSGLCRTLCRIGAWMYRLLNPERVRIATENLRPVVGVAAEATAARLFDQFALKLCDLWRYEAGLPVRDQFRELTGWENLEKEVDAGRGVLLITIHLGNWEFGAPLLASRGVDLLVLTQPEPGEGFTELRQAARAKWGIETLVVGGDPFAFVEIIKRLQAGRTVALLMDRPPGASSVDVELFGRPFAASVAAAELARASGCSLVPAYIPKTGSGYAAHILPAVPYDRAALNSRPARIALTAEILRVFEPAILEHPDQWFHFVPVWPASPIPSVQ